MSLLNYEEYILSLHEFVRADTVCACVCGKAREGEEER